MSNATVISENENGSNNRSYSVTTIALKPDFNEPNSIICLSIYRPQEENSMASGEKLHQRMSLTRARTLLGMVALRASSSNMPLAGATAWGRSRAGQGCH